MSEVPTHEAEAATEDEAARLQEELAAEPGVAEAVAASETEAAEAADASSEASDLSADEAEADETAAEEGLSPDRAAVLESYYRASLAGHDKAVATQLRDRAKTDPTIQAEYAKYRDSRLAAGETDTADADESKPAGPEADDSDTAKTGEAEEKAKNPAERIAELEQENANLRGEVTELTQRVDDLRTELGAVRGQLNILIEEVRRLGGDPDRFVAPTTGKRGEAGPGREKIAPSTELGQRIRELSMAEFDKTYQDLVSNGSDMSKLDKDRLLEAADSARNKWQSSLVDFVDSINKGYAEVVSGMSVGDVESAAELRREAAERASHDESGKSDDESDDADEGHLVPPVTRPLPAFDSTPGTAETLVEPVSRPAGDHLVEPVAGDHLVEPYDFGSGTRYRPETDTELSRRQRITNRLARFAFRGRRSTGQPETGEDELDIDD